VNIGEGVSGRITRSRAVPPNADHSKRQRTTRPLTGEARVAPGSTDCEWVQGGIPQPAAPALGTAAIGLPIVTAAPAEGARTRAPAMSARASAGSEDGPQLAPGRPAVLHRLRRLTRTLPRIVRPDPAARKRLDVRGGATHLESVA
jgi:hypothetical protein